MTTAQKTESSARNSVTTVLETLDRWSRRFTGHFAQKRSGGRTPYRAEIILYIPDAEEKAGESADSVAITVSTRNLSKGCIGFVYTELIPEDEIIVCLCDAKKRCTYLTAEIVRKRQIHDGFWEYGAKFKDHAQL